MNKIRDGRKEAQPRSRFSCFCPFTENNMYCRAVQGGKHKICFFPCLKYNYWEVSTPINSTEVYQSSQMACMLLLSRLNALPNSQNTLNITRVRQIWQVEEMLANPRSNFSVLSLHACVCRIAQTQWGRFCRRQQILWRSTVSR